MNHPETESPFVIARRNRDALERRAREMRAEQIANLVLAASRGVARGTRALARGARSLWRWALVRRSPLREHPAR
jgi:hypothetical protein